MATASDLCRTSAPSWVVTRILVDASGARDALSFGLRGVWLSRLVKCHIPIKSRPAIVL